MRTTSADTMTKNKAAKRSRGSPAILTRRRIRERMF
jgi:hypothetical protein